MSKSSIGIPTNSSVVRAGLMFATDKSFEDVMPSLVSAIKAQTLNLNVSALNLKWFLNEPLIFPKNERNFENLTFAKHKWGSNFLVMRLVKVSLCRLGKDLFSLEYLYPNIEYGDIDNCKNANEGN